jgi:hypothetical protein
MNKMKLKLIGVLLLIGFQILSCTQSTKEELLLGKWELVKNDDSFYAEIEFNEFIYNSTSNSEFCNYFYNSQKTLISRSALISAASEKIRNMFFNKLLKKMNDSKRKIGL